MGQGETKGARAQELAFDLPCRSHLVLNLVPPIVLFVSHGPADKITNERMRKRKLWDRTGQDQTKRRRAQGLTEGTAFCPSLPISTHLISSDPSVTSFRFSPPSKGTNDEQTKVMGQDRTGRVVRREGSKQGLSQSGNLSGLSATANVCSLPDQSGHTMTSRRDEEVRVGWRLRYCQVAW